MASKLNLKVTSFTDRKRKLKSQLIIGVLLFLALLACFPFLFISAYVISKGIGSLDWAFFTQLPKGPGETGGGMANAILGSGTMVLMCCLLGIPWGMAAGIYLSEYGEGKTARILRFATDLLTSVPSIVVGIFIYGLIVIYFGFSAHAGAIALAVIMLPIVARSTEEILKLIPNHIREAAQDEFFKPTYRENLLKIHKKGDDEC